MISVGPQPSEACIQVVRARRIAARLWVGFLVVLGPAWCLPNTLAQVPAESIFQQSEKAQGLAAQHLAEAGDANAQWMVGQAMLSPPSTDPAAAVIWLRRAGDQGHPLAQRDLGLLYEAGWGVERNLEEAYFWYSLAALHDSGRAAVRRDEIATGLNREQLDAAQRRLHTWRPSRETVAPAK